ncbi:MAG: helicase [Parcubacteria group bacterium]|nr:helicase [Parcubacteria group bacterium]|tara:strand:+ start:15624 stop:17273 length:1650 start_codon:yes stop_codon:yes gene_type:complete
MKQETALGILKTGRNVYLTGAAGSGKTHVLNQYIEYLREHRVGIGISASTGIAATHLGGMTIHSWAGIGIKDYLTEWDIDTLAQRQPLVKRFERASVLVIDEISMLRPELLDMVDAVAKALRRTTEPFGGLQVILSGDFFQLPPIVRDGSEDAFADSSKAWHEADFRTCYLTDQYRQEGGQLLDILNDIRDGEISIESQESLQSRMVRENVDASEYAGQEPVVLHTHNQNVDKRNFEELSKLKGQSTVYDMVSNGRANLVESLKKSVLAPEKLELKIGARVMFVKNNPDQEYVNGTLGEVVDLSGEHPVIKTHAGEEIVATPTAWETMDDNKVLASVAQVPLRLAWAITVHKSQGMSLDAVEVDLSRAFAPGQGYVALSRARTLEGLTLHGLNRTALEVHPYVRMRDQQLQAESQRWENIFSKFSETRIQEMQKTFISKVGRTESEASKATIIPTHIKTRYLLNEGKTLEDIIRERGMTRGTILAHLEKLKEIGEESSFAYLKPEDTFLKDTRAAFKKSGGTKLSPVYKALKGTYTYEDLRLARLFITE